MNKLAFITLTGAAIVGLTQQIARADYVVQVGYADTLRASPFFPNPWDGGANVDAFAGAGDPVNSFDAGAIRIINTGGSSITFGGMTVDSFGDGKSFTLWDSFIGTLIAPNHSMILTQTGTSFENFDTSDDQGGDSTASAVPRVVLTIDGTTKSFLDTAQVLNTEGSDHLAQAGLNESHDWREIGTFGGQKGGTETPDTGATASLLGLAVSAIVLIRRSAKA